MTAYRAEVFIDGRPILDAVVKASSPATAAARALRDALRLKRHRNRPRTHSVRLTKLDAVRPCV